MTRFKMIVPKRSRGKGYVNPCWICGERRHTDGAHFPKAKREGKEGKIQIFLCPTHHSLLDDGRLSKLEYEAILNHPMAKERFGRTFSNVEEFVTWAFEQGYDYALDNLKVKFWDHDPVEYSYFKRGPR